MDQPEPEVPEAPAMPETAKLVVWARHHITENWELLMKPPVLIALAAVAALFYYFGNTREAELLNTRNERLSFLNDQITAYRDRLSGATPDQAAGRIAQLQTTIEKQQKQLDIIFPENPRVLTEEQKNLIVQKTDEIKKILKAPLPVYASNLGDASVYATEFVTELLKAQIPVVGVMQTVCLVSQHGVLVGVHNVDAPTENAKSFFSILQEMKMDPHYTFWSEKFVPNNQDFDMFVCH